MFVDRICCFFQDGVSPLLLACNNGFKEVAEVLIAEGANVGFVDRKV